MCTLSSRTMQFLQLSLVDFTEPTLLTYLRYYCIIVAVRSLKWLPLWTWAFANRSRHSEVGEQTSETKFCCCGWICPLDISKDIGVASHMFTRKTIIICGIMFGSGYWYYLVRKCHPDTNVLYLVIRNDYIMVISISCHVND